LVNGSAKTTNAPPVHNSDPGQALAAYPGLYGRGEYTPVPVEYGQMLLFDGGLLSHGTVENTSSQTRVSMDLRFVPHGTGVLQRFFPSQASLAGGRPDQAGEAIAG
jgi:ectoine hydroxylase-related dioxygenase (phytanoyl-CoA dioxygenase family)